MRPLFMSLLVFAAIAANADRSHAGEIRFAEFSISPRQLAVGGSFDIRATVKAVDVPAANFVLRTTEPLAKDAVPPPFSLYDTSREFANLPENDGVHLMDNGSVDQDPKPRAFAVTISTKDWKPGRYAFGLFAHNRPGAGRHIVDVRGFTVTVEADAVRIEYVDPAIAPAFTQCALTETVVSSGSTTTLQIRTTGDLMAVRLQHQYHMYEEQVPPGLRYDDAVDVAYMADTGSDAIADNGPNDANPAEGAMDIRFDTTNWRPGLYHFAVVCTGPDGLNSPQRDVAFKVRSPQDLLDVTVSPSWRLYKGTHAERLAPLRNGELVYVSRYSTDKGKTWTKREEGTVGPGALQLRDGRIIGMDYRCLPIEGRKGWYRNSLYVSTDNGRTVALAGDAEFHVPQAKAAIGHAPHPGPLYMRSMVERWDGSLIALMAGWFVGDDTPCPYNPKRPYSRTYCCESRDQGKTWTYLNTIGYDIIGSEGYNEGSMKMLPDGRLMTVMRTGSMSDKKCHDNPIMVAFSSDNGATWSEPRRTGVNGAFPELCVLSDGLLAITYGRPGAGIMFSADGGLTWTDRTIIDATKYSGYTTMCETNPGEILVIFGTRGFYDAETGETRDDIRAAYVRYTMPTDPGVTDAAGALKQAGALVTDLGGGFVECSRRFEALKADEKFVVHFPEGYDPDRAQGYPLILFLHGAGRHCRTLLEDPRTRAVLAWSPAVVVLPNGRGSWWVDSPVEAGSRYQSYLDETLAFVEGSLNVSSDPARRGLGGWSMGGFGSMNYLIARPDRFAAWAGIVALLDFPNSAYPKDQNHSVPAVLGPDTDRFNPLRGVSGLKGKQLYFVTAIDAFDRAMNHTFHEHLKDAGIPHTFEVMNGAHTFDVVAGALPRAMKALHEAIGAE
ncbi:MAG: hypothetical protein GY851_01510 [bacterium]|nr:hypothetical protein [bacterium]